MLNKLLLRLTMGKCNASAELSSYALWDICVVLALNSSCMRTRRYCSKDMGFDVPQFVAHLEEHCVPIKVMSLMMDSSTDFSVCI